MNMNSKQLVKFVTNFKFSICQLTYYYIGLCWSFFSVTVKWLAV